MKRYLPFIVVVVVALVTLASGTVLYRAKRSGIWKRRRRFDPHSRIRECPRDNRGIRRFPMSALRQAFGSDQPARTRVPSAFARYLSSFPVPESRARARGGVCIGSCRAARALLGDARPTLSRAIRLERSG